MEYTKNYHLPQWVKSDRIMMEDFNQMCQDMEAGLTETKSSADTAQAVANEAKAEAQSLPYKIGSYTGTGEDVSVSLGFRPSFLIVCGMKEDDVGQVFDDWIYYSGITAGNTIPHRLVITNTGFIAQHRGPGLYYYPDLTDPERTYNYIAFK